MISLYEINPKRCNAVQVDLSTPDMLNETVIEVLKLINSHNFEIKGISIINQFSKDANEKQIQLTYLNGSCLQMNLKHLDYAFFYCDTLISANAKDLRNLHNLTPYESEVCIK